MDNKSEDIVRIVLVDDHPIVREGIIKLLENEREFSVVGEAGSVNEAVRVIERELPDVAIIDISIQGQSSGIELVKAVNNRFPDINCIVLSMHEELTYAERSLKYGARGYLTKNEAPSRIIDAIRAVMNGRFFVSESISEKFISRLVNGTEGERSTGIESLSNRELEVFRLFGMGHSSIQVADHLNLSKHTVDSHRRNIREKMGLKSNNDLVKSASQWIAGERE